MKKLFFICMMLIFIVVLNSCKQEKSNIYSEGFQENKNGEKTILNEQNLKDINEIEDENIEKYSGVWTTDGHPVNTIYTKTGGKILSIEVIGNYIKGSYVCVQGMSFRIASIDNIEAEIVSNVINFDFEDDGWGNSGKIKIIFEEDNISVDIVQLITNPDNITGMSVSNSVLVRENEEKEVSEGSSLEQQIIDTAIFRNGNKYWKEVTNWDEKNGRNLFLFIY